MITLYGIAGSRASRNMWMLNELELDYSSIPTNDRTGETRTPEFLAINPNGKVPLLIDGDLKLVESSAINLHLANKYERGMWFDDADEQGAAMQWSFWGMLEIDERIMDVLIAPNEPRGARGLANLRAAAAVLDTYLQEKSYLLDNRFTVADLNTATCFAGGAFMSYNFDEYPNLSRWLSECYMRPQAAIEGSILIRFRDLLKGNG
jgi:glutathione S-transferase